MMRDAYDLIDAADRGDLAQVRRELDAGAPVNGISDLGRTALHQAARRGHADIIRYLINRGVGTAIDLQDNDGKSPLMLAAEYCHLEAVEGLLGLGASATLRTTRSDTALHLAIKTPSTFADPLETVRRLAVLKDLVNSRTNDGRTPLMVTAALDTPQLTQALLDAGADATLTDNAERNAIQIAMHHGAAAVLPLLVGNVSSPFVEGASGPVAINSPLRLKIQKMKI